MSLGDEHEASGGYGGTGQTRTRLPDTGADPYGTPRRTRSSRSLVTVVGVVVLLIAAIAFANRGDDGPSSAGGSADKPEAAATAPSGERPVQATAGGAPSGFAHDQQGVESAAANYAVVLGSADMFDKAKRDAVLRAIISPSRVAGFEARLDKAYTPEFNKNIGLNEDGSAPNGFTFVSRTSPIGTKVTEYSASNATVEVWCSGLLGLAGENSTTPVTNSWFTITMQLEWAKSDWKIVTHSQKDGPTPVPGDDRASSADEMAKAVEEYGGFTYAR
ncbi:hypothetical protein MQE23_23905 [Streptomyces sp. HP-A2021]|uniref:hypothetical protein n=1 Tax=Streptomyces sp. HP-A2021 TaxID=2927875 RepID=UPI001FAE7743|nr:hypothetical protein [Streptomyces sp. HP-A2021]UOB11914.1 hypothetical protein MQE23_23905 [Streptomyces sp. HP-A2021]